MQIIDNNNSFNGIFSYSNLLVFSDLKTKMPYLLKQFPQFDEHQIEIISNSDPTKNKIYITWILKQLSTKKLIFPEDFGKTKRTLSNFDLLKIRKYFKEEKDINQYEDLGQLYDTIELYKEHLQDIFNKQLYNEEKKTLNNKGYIEVYRDDKFKILKVIDIDVAMEFAHGTNWCVAEEDNAKHYLDMGPLYFIYKNGNFSYALLHVESQQLKYTNDHELSMKDRLELEPIFVNNGIINNISYKYMILNDYHDYKPTKSELNYIVSNAALACNYAIKTLNRRFPEGEPAIATDAYFSYSYAIKFGRFELGEPTIAKDSYASIEYARNVIGGRFELGEESIAKNPGFCFEYISFLKNIGIDYIIPKIEQGILEGIPFLVYKYVSMILDKKPFPEGEEKLAQNPNTAEAYARNILKPNGIIGFPLGEPAIATNTEMSLNYIRHVIKRRFPEYEKYLFEEMDIPVYFYNYAACLQDLGIEIPKEIIQKIAEDPLYSYQYAINRIRDRFPEGESSILNSTYEMEYLNFLRKKGYVDYVNEYVRNKWKIEKND